MPLQHDLLSSLIRDVEVAGSDHVPTFGGLYEGGYHIQQVPEELARLTLLLAARSTFESSLEIGVAAGGTTRFLREHIDIRQTVVIDDGHHRKAGVWREQNRHAIPNVTEFQGDSHSNDAHNFLLQLGRSFDLVAIDGDHSADGVRADWNLVVQFLQPRAIVWFHDINVCPGVAELWRELRNKYRILLETSPLGIGVLEYCTQSIT